MYILVKCDVLGKRRLGDFFCVLVVFGERREEFLFFL